jgi:hypothetical protein
MTIWNETFLNKIRTYWKGMIDTMQLQTAESTWTDLTIVEKTIEGNAIAVFWRVPDVQFTAVNIRVIDSDGDVAGVTPESIAKTSDDTFYMTFRFNLTQEV